MNLKPFHVIVLGVFALCAVGGIFFFATYRGFSSKEVQVGSVVIWGTLPKETVNFAITELKKSDSDYSKVSYIEKSADTFSNEYVQALAESRGPDLIILPAESLLERAPTLLVIPYTSLPERSFKDTYVEAAEVYLTPEGVMGIPFTLDPLVLFWNRTILSSKGVAKAPQYWDELYTLAPSLTTRDQNLTITKSAVALGEFANIKNAKDILVAMLLQTGTPITKRDDKGVITSVLNKHDPGKTSPAQDVVRYFTEFSNPTRNLYSWNRSFSEAQRSFISGDLAIYFGFASEVLPIRDANPNLNFDVAAFPQIKGGETPATVAHLTAFAIPKASGNVQGAYRVATALSSANILRSLSARSGLPPVRRDLLAETPSDPYLALFNRQALITKSWLDPNGSGSGTIFKNMIDAVTTGRLTISEAVNTASQQLDTLLR